MSRQQLPNNDEIVEHFNQQKLQSGLVVGGCWGDHETGKSGSRKKQFLCNFTSCQDIQEYLKQIQLKTSFFIQVGRLLYSNI